MAALVALLLLAAIAAVAAGGEIGAGRSLAGTIGKRLACGPRLPDACRHHPLVPAYGWPLARRRGRWRRRRSRCPGLPACRWPRSTSAAAAARAARSPPAPTSPPRAAAPPPSPRSSTAAPRSAGSSSSTGSTARPSAGSASSAAPTRPRSTPPRGRGPAQRRPRPGPARDPARPQPLRVPSRANAHRGSGECSAAIRAGRAERLLDRPDADLQDGSSDSRSYPLREIGIKELKNTASRVIEEVEAGERVVVTKRGRPTA